MKTDITARLTIKSNLGQYYPRKLAKTPVAGSLGKYLSEISSYSILGNGENAAFTKFAVAETRLILKMASNREGKEHLLEAMKNTDIHIPRKLSARVAMTIRATEPGRDWIRTQLERSKNKSILSLGKKCSELFEQLVNQNLRLVVSTAKKYSRFCSILTIGDLIQEGNIGLIKAVERYDPSRGTKFSTYAVWWLRHHVKRAISERDPLIRIPVHMSDLMGKVYRSELSYISRTGQKPTDQELADCSNVNTYKIELVQKSRVLNMFRLDAPAGDSGDTFLDFMSDDRPSPMSEVEGIQTRDRIQNLLSVLTPMESSIIRWRFGLDTNTELTLKEIAVKYDLSRERIRQIQEKALEKIRRHIHKANTESDYSESA
jgi:RNA polymerase sigma factor (sigma-70 family)